MNIGQSIELALIDLNLGGVIGCARPVIGQTIGGDLDDVPMNDRRNALFVGGQMNLGTHAGMNLADIVDRDPSFDVETVALGNNIENFLAFRDHGSHGKDREPHDLAGIGRTDFRAIENGFGVGKAGDNVEQVRLGILQTSVMR